MGALVREQLAPEVSGEGFGMSESRVPVIKHRLVTQTAAHIYVDEVGVLGCPVELQRAVSSETEEISSASKVTSTVCCSIIFLLSVVGWGSCEDNPAPIS